MQCHGEHTLVEIFTKRNFTCDCGTFRLPATSPCTLRLNPETKARGGVHSEEPSANNKYNQNFRNRFCVCECYYDPFQQKGTMFQCLGLGTHETGGCGEDWYHPGCVVGLGPNWFEKTEGKTAQKPIASHNDGLPSISEGVENSISGDAAPTPADDDAGEDDDDVPNPPGFPKDEEFETFICFKCVEAHPWIKRYAGTPGFLDPVRRTAEQQSSTGETALGSTSKKRKAEEDQPDDSRDESKKIKSDSGIDQLADGETQTGTADEEAASATKQELLVDAKVDDACKYDALPAASEGIFSVFCTESFRDRFCRCAKCFPDLAAHAQLLEEEEVYEPPISEEGSEHGGSTQGSGSLYERGESALRNVDRVRAIEGVMAYNQLKDKLKPFFQQFADSGKAIGADDIKEYFAKLRGDDEAIKEAGESAKSDNRKEQPGY